MNDRRSKLADYDTCRTIGDCGRRRHVGPGREHHTQRCDHCVASAADVKHFPRMRGNIQGSFGTIQRHPLLATREQQRTQIKLGAQCLRLGG